MNLPRSTSLHSSNRLRVFLNLLTTVYCTLSVLYLGTVYCTISVLYLGTVHCSIYCISRYWILYCILYCISTISRYCTRYQLRLFWPVLWSLAPTPWTIRPASFWYVLSHMQIFLTSCYLGSITDRYWIGCMLTVIKQIKCSHYLCACTKIQTAMNIIKF